MSARPVRPVTVAAILALGVALGACNGSTPSPVASPSAPAASPTASIAAPSPSPSAPAASLLLKVTSEGGFINPAASINALPIVEVWDDGTILTPGATDAIDPGALLPPVEERSVGAEGAGAILDAIRAAGLDRAPAGGPGVPGDSGTDIFAVTIRGETTETRIAGGGGPGVGGPGVGGPGVGGPGASGSGAPDERAAALALLGRLLDPAETWGAASAPTSPYQPAGYRVFASPGAPQVDPSVARPPVAWPLATPLASFGTPAQPDFGIAGLRQGAVVGGDAATLGPILKAATTATGFTSGGQTWTLNVRPLLPDELGS